MTCKIERFAAEAAVVLRLSGHLQAAHLRIIEELMTRAAKPLELDLAEITLVEREAVKYLAGYERAGVKLKDCPPFLRAWMIQQQARPTATPPTAAGEA